MNFVNRYLTLNSGRAERCLLKVSTNERSLISQRIEKNIIYNMVLLYLRELFDSLRDFTFMLNACVGVIKNGILEAFNIVLHVLFQSLDYLSELVSVLASEIFGITDQPLILAYLEIHLLLQLFLLCEELLLLTHRDRLLFSAIKVYESFHQTLTLPLLVLDLDTFEATYLQSFAQNILHVVHQALPFCC